MWDVCVGWITERAWYYVKGFKKAPLLWLLLGSFLILTIVSLLGYTAENRHEKLNMIKEPFLTVTFQSIGEGEFPFRLEQYLFPEVELVDANEKESEDGETSLSEDGAATGKESEKGQGEGSVGENMAPKQYEYQTVGKEYFQDALFIGDSRTDGLARYSGLDNATFYAKNSLTIFDFFDKRFIPVEGETEKLTLEEALQQKTYGKIYIMFGINELGSCSRERFGAEYLRVLTRIRELQPNAILFVQGMMRVTATKSAEDSTYNNVNINIRNALLAIIDNHHDVFYLDMNDAVCDENGDLNADYTFDDVHLKARYYDLWVHYLMEHGIIQD